MALPIPPENNCRLVKGENCLVLRGHMMAQVEWLETMFLQSVAAHHEIERSRPALANLHFMGCWIEFLPPPLEPVSVRLMQGERVLGDVLRIRSAIISSHIELARLDSAFALEFMHPGWPSLGPLVVHQALNSDLVLKHFGSTVAGAQSGSAFWLLLEFLWPFIEPAYQAGLKYYGVDESGTGSRETRQALFAAVFTSMFACNLTSFRQAATDQAIPAAYFHLLLRTIREQFLLMLGILGLIGEHPSGLADIGPDLTAINDEKQFAEAFHVEWERALQFEDGFYGFHVVPNVGWTDIERYLKLCYRGHETVRKVTGYREEIRWEACSFIIHQAKVSANLIVILAPEKAAQEYEKAVATVFQPLISASGHRVASARRRGEGTDARYRTYLQSADVQAAHVFRTAYRRFKFYFKETEEDPLYRSYGLLRQNGKRTLRVQPLFAEALECDGRSVPKEISFPRYVESVLDRWVSEETNNAHAGRELRVGAPEKLDDIDNKDFPMSNDWERAVIDGPNGEQYVTIVQLAGRLKCPEHQLRRLDKELGVRRVREVFGGEAPSLGRVKLRPSTRLYELAGDLISQASQLVGRIGHARLYCKTEGITRAELSSMYGIPRHTILYWEKLDLVTPVREGGHVIYPPDQVKLVKKFAGVDQD